MILQKPVFFSPTGIWFNMREKGLEHNRLNGKSVYASSFVRAWLWIIPHISYWGSLLASGMYYMGRLWGLIAERGTPGQYWSLYPRLSLGCSGHLFFLVWRIMNCSPHSKSRMEWTPPGCFLSHRQLKCLNHGAQISHCFFKLFLSGCMSQSDRRATEFTLHIPLLNLWGFVSLFFVFVRWYNRKCVHGDSLVGKAFVIPAWA